MSAYDNKIFEKILNLPTALRSSTFNQLLPINAKSIINLPTELRSKIFKYLLCTEDEATLAKLARINKKTYNIVIPRLYEVLSYRQDELEDIVSDIAIHHNTSDGYGGWEASIDQNKQKFDCLKHTKSLIIEGAFGAQQTATLISEAPIPNRTFNTRLFSNLDHVTLAASFNTPYDYGNNLTGTSQLIYAEGCVRSMCLHVKPNPNGKPLMRHVEAQIFDFAAGLDFPGFKLTLCGVDNLPPLLRYTSVIQFIFSGRTTNTARIKQVWAYLRHVPTRCVPTIEFYNVSITNRWKDQALQKLFPDERFLADAKKRIRFYACRTTEDGACGCPDFGKERRVSEGFWAVGVDDLVSNSIR